MSYHTDGETEAQSLCGSHLHNSPSEALGPTGLRSWRGKISSDRQAGLYVTFTGHPLERVAALSSSHQHSEKQLCLAEEARKGQGAWQGTKLPAHRAYWGFSGGPMGVGGKGDQNTEQVCRVREGELECTHLSTVPASGCW